MLNPLSRAQLETITLWYLVQHSLSSFYKISQHYAELANAIQQDRYPSGRHSVFMSIMCSA